MFRADRLVGFVRLLPLAFLVTIAFAQGSAGGYGQGSGTGTGTGGGFGGGGRMGGHMNGPGAAPQSEADDSKKPRPDEEDIQGLWDTRTAILTPGDRVEFKVKLKVGETLLAGVTSDAFDPALSVEDSKGAVVAKNDDRAEGDQSPFLIYRSPAEGTYTLKVLSYHSVSGGKFTVKMRSFQASDAPLQKTTHDNVALIELDRANPRIVFRIPAKKGKIYDLRYVSSASPNARYECRLAHIIGPTGVESNDFQMIPTRDDIPVFEALADGDYYLEYNAFETKQYQTDFHDVAVLAGKPTMNVQIDLESEELKIIEFPVEPNLIVRTTFDGSRFTDSLSAPAGDPRRFNENGDQSYGNSRFWLWFKPDIDSDSDVVRIFHGSGTARYAIRSNAPKPTKVGFKNTESLPVWTPGDPFKSSIDIGDTRLLLIKSDKSELMRVAALADHFQPRLDIFRFNGDLANSLCDRQTHKAADDLYFPDADTFIARLSCDGHGGSGDFSMKRATLTAAPYALGSPQSLKLDGVNFGLYEVNLEAGKRYELMTDEPGKMIRADLLDEDGQFLVSQAIRFDKVIVQYFVPTRSGRHRLWLRGEPGERHFKFSLHVPPTIGG